MGEAAALAVVGFGQVDELEVERKGACELVGTERVGGFGGDRGELGFLLAARDGGEAQGFDSLVNTRLGLLAQHLAEQHAERTHVAAQGRGL